MSKNKQNPSLAKTWNDLKYKISPNVALEWPKALSIPKGRRNLVLSLQFTDHSGLIPI